MAEANRLWHLLTSSGWNLGPQPSTSRPTQAWGPRAAFLFPGPIFVQTGLDVKSHDTKFHWLACGALGCSFINARLALRQKVLLLFRAVFVLTMFDLH